jgi:lycopene beta-cyclase
MTYFEFLLIFLALPIIVLMSLEARKGHAGGRLWWTVAVQVALALAYTTPWDNHLVATGVWHYSPKQVAGLVLGYVPLEEYAFFVLETLLVGLWWHFCSVRVRPSGDMRGSTKVRAWAAGSIAVLWAVLAIIFLRGWRPGTYLLLILLWALPPVLLQLAYGADALWHERRLVAAVIIPVGVYLSAADALAIRAGIWAIDPAQSTGLFLGGLPVEEALFFFITVILITFGMTLALSEDGRERLRILSRMGKRATTSE